MKTVLGVEIYSMGDGIAEFIPGCMYDETATYYFYDWLEVHPERISEPFDYTNNSLFHQLVQQEPTVSLC